jgi:hypothetical protein
VVRALIATAAVGLLATAGCGGSGTDNASRGESVLVGDWTGRLHQEGIPPFGMAATIASPTGSAGNEVHYTGIDCSGTWSSLGSSGSTHRFREVIDRGESAKCKGVGVVTLTTTFSRDRLSYEFRGGGVTSRGMLRRLTSP